MDKDAIGRTYTRIKGLEADRLRNRQTAPVRRGDAVSAAIEQLEKQRNPSAVKDVVKQLEDQGYGGGKNTRRRGRKTNRRKTNRRKTNKRKTNKRKTNKRKTNRRKLKK
jgi:hypothetical protein